MKPLNQLFNVTYGNKLDLNKMERLSLPLGGIPFVGRSGENNGISAYVSQVPGTKPYPAGAITVALGGALLSSFVQQAPFYTAQNVAVLIPIKEMSFHEKVYYCECIRHNRFRYSTFGREANRTLRTLPVPDISEIPEWVARGASLSERDYAGVANPDQMTLDVRKWRKFSLGSLFKMKKGKRLTKAEMIPGKTPFIGAIDGNNGVSAYVAQPALHPANTLTVNYNGNGVAEAFYQPHPYRCSDDVHALYPQFSMTAWIGLFIAAIIRRERYRFSYGRKWHLGRMKQSKIKLPVTPKGTPDWEYMERYMRALPYSASLPKLDA